MCWLLVRTFVALALALLGCGAPPANARPTTVEPREGAVETALRAHAEALCQAGPTIVVGDTAPGPCEAVDVQSVGDEGLRAAVADVRLGGQIWSVLAVRTGDDLRVGTLASGWSPGVGGHSAEGSSTLEALDLVPGEGLEVHATFTGETGDSDMGSCDFRGQEGVVHVVCSADDGALRCVAVETTRIRTREHTLCDGASDADGGEPVPVELEIHVRDGFALAVTLGMGLVTLTPSAADTVAPPFASEIAADALLARDDLAWPTRFEILELLAN